MTVNFDQSFNRICENTLRNPEHLHLLGEKGDSCPGGSFALPLPLQALALPLRLCGRVAPSPGPLLTTEESQTLAKSCTLVPVLDLALLDCERASCLKISGGT